MLKPLCSLLLGAAMYGAAFAQDTPKKGPSDQPKPSKGNWWAIDLGVYLPVDSDIQDRFGNVLFRAGIRPYQIHRRGNMMLAFDLTFITAANRGNHLLAIPATLGLLSAYGDPDDEQRFFWDVGAGPAYFDYDIDRVNGQVVTNFKDRGWGWGAHAEAGLTIRKRTTITARYDWLSEKDGFNFGGFSVNLSYAAMKW